MSYVRHYYDNYTNYTLGNNWVKAQYLNEEADQDYIYYKCRPINRIEPEIFAKNIAFGFKHEEFIANICISESQDLTHQQYDHIVKLCI